MYDVVTDQKFDIFIMTIILANMVTMALEHYNQADDFSKVLEFINLIFIVVFTFECVMKLIGLRYHYFKAPWNVFDFVIVVTSILGKR